MNLSEPWSFPESTVTGFIRVGNSVRLEMIDVDVEEERRSVVVEVLGVHRIEIDNEVSTSELMAAEDGEVLTLEKTASSLYVIIEWNTWAPRRSFIHSYRVFGEAVRVSVQKKGVE